MCSHTCQRTRTQVAYEYLLHGQILESVGGSKYLGMEISDNLSLNNHIQKICTSASRSLGFIKHNIRTKSPAYRHVYTRADYYKYSFYPLAIVQWNRLPSKIALLPTFEGSMHDQPPNAINASALFIYFNFHCQLVFLLLKFKFLTLSSFIHSH